MDTSELSGLADTTVTVMVAGEAIPLKRLRPIDLAQATEFVRQRRLADADKTLPWNAIVAESRGAVLAKIACTPVTIFECLDDWHGRMKLIHVAVRRAGRNLSFEELADKLDPIGADEFFWLLAELSGIAKRPKEAPPADPTSTFAASNTGPL